VVHPFVSAILTLADLLIDPNNGPVVVLADRANQVLAEVAWALVADQYIQWYAPYVLHGSLTSVNPRIDTSFSLEAWRAIFISSVVNTTETPV
jgi:hypothetical protein